jgi:hypothetical protein
MPVPCHEIRAAPNADIRLNNCQARLQKDLLKCSSTMLLGRAGIDGATPTVKWANPSDGRRSGRVGGGGVAGCEIDSV